MTAASMLNHGAVDTYIAQPDIGRRVKKNQRSGSASGRAGPSIRIAGLLGAAGMPSRRPDLLAHRVASNVRSCHESRHCR